MANRNSSITRVRPFFDALFDRDPTGRSWLPAILMASDTGKGLDADIVRDPGEIKPLLAETRSYSDRVLKRFGVETINLRNCFEYRVAPPTAFLQWLLRHPDQLSWPTKGDREATYGARTQLRREWLIGRGTANEASDAQAEALAALAQDGSEGSALRWWAFEGFTEVDCFLETDRLILFIEGKRTEGLSKSTDWFPERNQLLRNLEAVAERAGDREFAVLLAIEAEDATLPDDDAVDASVPHLSPAQRSALRKHLLGPTTWRVLCDAVGISFEALPNTSEEVAKQLSS